MKKTDRKKLKKVVAAVACAAAVAVAAAGAVLLVRACRPVEVADRPQPVETAEQPFVSDVTGESKNFRIPAMVTLDSGRIVAAADARYDMTQDGGGLDTVVAFSDDNGKAEQSCRRRAYSGIQSHRFHEGPGLRPCVRRIQTNPQGNHHRRRRGGDRDDEEGLCHNRLQRLSMGRAQEIISSSD